MNVEEWIKDNTQTMEEWSHGEAINRTDYIDPDDLLELLKTHKLVPANQYPMQPIVDNRFEANPIVNWLCTKASDMNKISIYAQENNIDAKYQEQIAQLVGYSVGGYSDLSYVTDESYDRVMDLILEEL